MSVLIKGVKMPKEGCKDCFIVKRGQVFDICPLIKREVNGNVERGGKPNNCPLIEVPPHGDLIDKEILYNKTAEFEAQAMAQLEKLNEIPLNEMDKEEYIAWRVWSAICQERSAFKFDVFDAPVVLKGESDATD